MTAGWSSVSIRVDVLAAVLRALDATLAFRFSRGTLEIVRWLRRVTGIIKHQIQSSCRDSDARLYQRTSPVASILYGKLAAGSMTLMRSR